MAVCGSLETQHHRAVGQGNFQPRVRQDRGTNLARRVLRTLTASKILPLGLFRDSHAGIPPT